MNANPPARARPEGENTPPEGVAVRSGASTKGFGLWSGLLEVAALGNVRLEAFAREPDWAATGEPL